MFRIGQKITCIAVLESSDALKFIPNRPVLNGVYTVRADALVYNEQYLLLEELHNPADDWSEIGYGEPPFWHGLFRPLVERKTDISIFTAMLTPSPVTVDALNMADFARELVQ